ncbi:MAG: N-acetylmuramoyl-L-alanine amidase [Crocinitomicaceae bacterium]|nr:N-acetylmuramoyl-L-alanine amidase [Flavobacteriales bacterium]NQZ37786.1 N-acetylmuramoyl-L-alanine amidase [Crocinitomicaceae bacterium]
MMENRKVSRCLIVFLTMITMFGTQKAIAQDDESVFATLKTVVIDAGHGGKDPGCHGGHAQEKTVCLTMALMLGEQIKKDYPSINVIYTRDTDVFVELNERAKIANRNNADLFICIHANAASAAAYGTETYVLGLHRTQSQQAVAARENATIHLEDDGGKKYEDFNMTPDAIIARQIQLSVFLDQSISFADKIQAEFTSLGRYDRGVKQAGFIVLYKTTMPSVLIETGFLTNPKEEKYLSDSTTQRQMANAMFTAFKKYKNELEGVEGQVETNNTERNVNHESIDSIQIPVDPIQVVEKKDVVIFKVQVETATSPIALTDRKFKGYSVSEYVHGGLYKYTFGTFENDVQGAIVFQRKLREQGYPHAFVVAFLNGERINLQKAIILAEK